MQKKDNLTKEYIKSFITILGFNILEGEDEVWIKQFSQYNNFTIKIDLRKDNLTECKIQYDEEIKVWRNTTTNFSQKENLVVLDCVNRLLEKGYEPKSIELEKNWKVGGYLDVFVKNKQGKSYLMIECKQWGKEHNNALKIHVSNEYKKEQLFNYYIQEKSTKYVALYSSTLVDNSTVYVNDIVHVEQFKTCNNQNEIHEKWDKTFQSKGIFESSINPYDVKFIGITKGDLKTLDKLQIGENGEKEGTIYNRFAEILRRHTISDKTNAYNKIFNLFLCKIVDEDNISNNNGIMDFQWEESEDAEIVLSRLNDLYKKGMKDYLKLDVADITENELDKELIKISGEVNNNTKKIRAMFKELRLYKNNEFAFKEVIDKRTFLENSEVVKEVIKLLEPFQIKYSHKQQFLGDFFERLLNIGIKQEAGQFFTPIPITNFVCKSIPFEEIITTKIEDKDPDFLPYIIDFACGSGHFLTESMDRVDKILQGIDENKLKTKPQRDNFTGWNVSFKWASEFVYGIENDYRLAKTTKVASFLNGDGEAKILYTDGLGSFNSQKYFDKLYSTEIKKDNQVFDVVIANPPYSVENFKFVLKDGKDSFDLYDEVTDKSDDIECFFVERTKQLLKEGGYAGIILPSTLLLNKGVQQKTREIILKYFEISGICEFGNKTFAAAGQNTVILFLKRRDNDYWQKAESIAKNFMEIKKDFGFNNQEKMVDKYISLFYPDLKFNEYIKKLEDDEFKNDEQEKMFYFLLSYNQRVIITKSGEKEELKKFLGYEHSNMKKYEGIHPYPHNEEGKIDSILYDDETLNNPNKVSSFILKNFKKEELPKVSGKLTKYLEIKNLHEIMDFDSEDYKNRIFLDALENPFINLTKYPLEQLSNQTIAENLDCKREPIKKSKRKMGEIPYYGASGVTGNIDSHVFDEKLVLIGEDGAKWGKGEKTAYIIEGKSWVNNHAHVIRPNKDRLLHEWLEAIFTRLDFSYLKTRPNGGKLQKTEMEAIKFPLPNTSVQKAILLKISEKKGQKWDVFDKELGI